MAAEADWAISPAVRRCGKVVARAAGAQHLSPSRLFFTRAVPGVSFASAHRSALARTGPRVWPADDREKFADAQAPRLSRRASGCESAEQTCLWVLPAPWICGID